MINFIDKFEDYGIIGINYFSNKQQYTQCPNCSSKRKPQHQKLKVLGVNAERGIWNCNHCNFSGSLKRDFNKHNFKPIVSKSKPLAKVDFFTKRGISKETVEANKITKDTVFIPGVEKETAVICFNYYVGDSLVNIKYRTLDKHFAQVKGGAKVFYGLNDIQDSIECIIVEGEMDKLSFYEAGFKNCLSVPDGAINPNVENIDTKLNYLDTCAAYLSHIDKFYLATDNDAPGIRLREELARRLGKSKCFIVNFPEDCKDANDVLVKHGKDKLASCIKNAAIYPVEGIFTANDRDLEIQYLYENGYPNGARTGKWEELDEKLTFHDSVFTVITGIPSHGKSNFMDHLMICLAITAGWKFAVFSPENSKIEIHVHRLAEILVGKPFLPGYNGRMTPDELQKAIEFINQHIFFILPENEEFTFNRILEAASYLVLKEGVKGFIIDPWNVIQHDYSKSEKKTDYTEVMLNKLIFFTRNHGLHTFVIVHPRKMQKKYDDKKYPVPTLYDIMDSSNWYNKAEIGICVYRDFDINDTTIFIQKVKHRFMGKVGFVKFNFDVKSQRYYEINKPRKEQNYLQEYIPLADGGYPKEWDTIPSVPSVWYNEEGEIF